jgi:hypothetical protein
MHQYTQHDGENKTFHNSIEHIRNNHQQNKPCPDTFNINMEDLCLGENLYPIVLTCSRIMITDMTSTACAALIGSSKQIASNDIYPIVNVQQYNTNDNDTVGFTFHRKVKIIILFAIMARRRKIIRRSIAEGTQTMDDVDKQNILLYRNTAICD